MNCSKGIVSSWLGQKDILLFNHIPINWGMAVLQELPAAGSQCQQNKSHVLNLGRVLFSFYFGFYCSSYFSPKRFLAQHPGFKAFDLKSG